MDDTDAPNSFKDAMKEASYRKYPNTAPLKKGMGTYEKPVQVAPFDPKNPNDIRTEFGPKTTERNHDPESDKTPEKKIQVRTYGESNAMHSLADLSDVGSQYSHNNIWQNNEFTNDNEFSTLGNFDTRTYFTDNGEERFVQEIPVDILKLIDDPDIRNYLWENKSRLETDPTLAQVYRVIGLRSLDDKILSDPNLIHRPRKGKSDVFSQKKGETIVDNWDLFRGYDNLDDITRDVFSRVAETMTPALNSDNTSFSGDGYIARSPSVTNVNLGHGSTRGAVFHELMHAVYHLISRLDPEFHEDDETKYNIIVRKGDIPMVESYRDVFSKNGWDDPYNARESIFEITNSDLRRGTKKGLLDLINISLYTTYITEKGNGINYSYDYGDKVYNGEVIAELKTLDFMPHPFPLTGYEDDPIDYPEPLHDYNLEEIMEETLSTIVEIMAEGEMNSPLVQKIVAPMMPYYYMMMSKLQRILPASATKDERAKLHKIYDLISRDTRRYDDARDILQNIGSWYLNKSQSSFKDTMKDVKKSYGPKDFAATHIEKIDWRVLMGDGDPRRIDDKEMEKYTSMEFNPLPEPYIQRGNTVQFNNEYDATAVRSLARLDPETMKRTFGTEDPFITFKVDNGIEDFGRFTGIKPNRVGQFIGNAFKLDSNGIPIFDKNGIAIHSDAYDAWQKRKVTGRHRDLAHTQAIDRFKRLRDNSKFRSFFGNNVLRTEGGENGKIFKPELPVDYNKENTDPDVLEDTKRMISNTIMGDDMKENILDMLVLDKDELSDLRHTIIGMNNLGNDKQVIDALGMVLPLLYSTGYINAADDGSDNIGGFRPHSKYPSLYYSNGEVDLNHSTHAGEMSTRFHEAMHAMTHAYFQMMPRTTGNTEYGYSIYDSDADFVDAFMEMSQIPEVVAEKNDDTLARNLDYILNKIPNSGMKRGSVNKVLGEIMFNCRMLNMLLNDYGYQEIIDSVDDWGFGNLQTIHAHPPQYFLLENRPGGKVRWRQIKDVTRLIINETLSNMMELHINGDLRKKEVQMIVKPLMGPYLNVLGTLAEMIQSPFTMDEIGPFREKLLNSYVGGYGSDKVNAALRGRFSGKSKQASAKIRKSAIKKLNQDALKFNGGRKVDDLPRLRNEDEFKALGSLVDSGLVPKEIVNNTFGRDILTEHHDWVSPQYGVPEPKTSIINTSGLPKKERKAAEIHNNKEWAKRSEHHLKDQIFREMFARHAHSSRIGSNQVKLTTDDKGNVILDLSLPADVIAENNDPEIMEQLMGFWDNNADTDAGELYRGMRLDGESSIYPYNMTADTNSDKIHTVRGIENLDDDTLKSLAIVANLLGRAAYSNQIGIDGGTLVPSNKHIPAWVKYSNGDSVLNSPLSGDNNSVRFHEFRHAVSVIRNTLSNKKKTKVGNGVVIYESDIDEIKGMLAMGAGKLFTDEGSLREYTRRVAYDSGLKRGTVNRVLGELVANTRILSALLGGMTPLTMLNMNKDLFENPNIVDRYSHGSDYYSSEGNVIRSWIHSTDATTEDVISRIINETLSAMIQLEANGDLYKPIVQEMVGPFMPAYKEFTKKFLDMMPSGGRFDSADKLEANKALLSDKRNSRNAKQFITRYASKSAEKIDFTHHTKFKKSLIGKLKDKSICKSTIKKLNDEALKFDGGRHVDWPYQERYRRNLDMQNDMEQDVYYGHKKIMPWITENTVFSGGKDAHGSVDRDNPPTGSRYGKWDIRTTFDDNGKEVLLRTWPFEGAEASDFDIDAETFDSLDKIVSEHADDPQFQRIFDTMSLKYMDNAVANLANAQWIDRLSDNTKIAMDNAAGTLFGVRENSAANGSYKTWDRVIEIPYGNMSLNGSGSGIDVRAHELMHTVFNTMFDLDPELTKIGRPRGFKVPMYAGTVNYVNTLDKMKDYFGYDDPYKTRDTLLDVMRSDLSRGSKKALAEILFAIEGLPLLAHGMDPYKINDMLVDRMLIPDIPNDYMPHEYRWYYLAAGHDDERAYIPNVILLWVNEIQSSMAQLEANGDLDKVYWLRPLISPYRGIIKRAKYLITRPKNEDEKKLYGVFQDKTDNRQKRVRNYVKQGYIANMDKLRGESFRRSAKFRKSIIEKLSDA